MAKACPTLAAIFACSNSTVLAYSILTILSLLTCKCIGHCCGNTACVNAVAAIVATRNDDMLRDLFKHMSEFDLSFFSNSTASQFVRHFLLKGTLQDIEVLQKRLRRLLGDLTFLEAFILSGSCAKHLSTSTYHETTSAEHEAISAKHEVLWLVVMVKSLCRVGGTSMRNSSIVCQH